MTDIWLIRHAEPEECIRGRCYGSLDVGLSATGREDAASLADRLADEPLAAIYSSPRIRAIQTAGAIAAPRGLAITLEPAFRELDFGDFEGRAYDEIAAAFPELYRRWMETPTEVRFPNGESFRQMRERVLAAHGSLLARHEGQNIAIVAHGGTARIIIAEALGIPPANIFRIAQKHAALNRLRCYDGCCIVEALNA